MSGTAEKESAVSSLYAKGRVSQPSYKNNCPLCELFNKLWCKACPWPGGGLTRCENVHSPYLDWALADDSRKGLQQAASRVYQLVKTFGDE